MAGFCEGETGAYDEIKLVGWSSGVWFKNAQGAFFQIVGILKWQKFHLALAENAGEKEVSSGVV